MSIQQTLLIVKPDGMAKGLTFQILYLIRQHQLTVVDNVRLRLSREWVAELYNGLRTEPPFEAVVNWMSSAPVLLLIINGLNAVEIVKKRIIGKYPDGLRGQYSENAVMNVVHASDSLESAYRELALAMPLFRRRALMDNERLQDKVIFALTGMSECGKSTVGKYLDSIGIPRLKIVKIFERVRDLLLQPDLEREAFVKEMEQKDPYALWDAFIDELLQEMNRRGVNMASIESLYGGGLGPYLKQRLGDHFFIIYIDASLDKRLELQMIRQQLSDIEAAKELLLPRDKIKVESGIPQLMEIADEIINNAGNIDELYRAVDNLVTRHSVE